jgi:hypothetical protein
MAIQHESRPVYDDGDREYRAKRDDKENLETQPPKGEQINRPLLMTAECYVGGDVARLVDGIAALGLKEDHAVGTQNLAEWASGVRSGSHFGSYTTVGALRQVDGTPRTFMGAHPVVLPDEFARVYLHAYAPTPAVVVLVATFVLTADSARQIDDELRTNRYLRLDVDGSVTTFVGAASRKREAIDGERRKVLKAASEWLAWNVPGTLTNDFDGDDLPSIEFLTTQKEPPFTPQSKQDFMHSTYRNLLGIDSDWEAWESKDDLPKWRIGMPFGRKGAKWCIVAGCVETPIPTDDKGKPARRASKLQPHPSEHWQVAETFGPLLVRWALRCLLLKYEGSLARVRDQLTGDPPKKGPRLRRRTSPGGAKNAERVLSALAFDASVVTQELHDLASDKRNWEHEVPDLTASAEFRKDDYPTFSELLADDVKARSIWATNLEARLREQLTVVSNLELAATNIRLQRQVFWLTCVTVVIAVVGVVISARTGS